MPVQDAKEKIDKAISSLENVASSIHRFGGTEYKLGKRELGHIHGNFLVDIPFPKKIKEKLISEGKANNHHILPQSGWISKYLNSPKDVDEAIELFKLSYKLAIKQKMKREEKSTHQL